MRIEEMPKLKMLPKKAFRGNSGGSRIFLKGALTPKVGVLAIFIVGKLHENERIWAEGWARPWGPLRSANGKRVPDFLSLFSFSYIFQKR